MAYEQLIREFKSTKPVGESNLQAQPRYATLTLLASLILISLALITAYSKRSFGLRLVVYALLSAGGSMLFAIGAIYLSNSVGVYI